MYRYYDWECGDCDLRHGMVGGGQDRPSDPSPDTAVIECPRCGPAQHTKVVSRPAKYLGDQADSPMVMGGNYDTMGYRKSKLDMPQPPDDWNDFSASQVQDFFQQPEWKAWRDDEKRIAKEDKARRERTRLIKSGANIDVKHHPLPGDPKLT